MVGSRYTPGTHDLPCAVSKEPERVCQSQADARTRTGDPFITSEVLYQLSYVGEAEAV
jgi:hypothetical protein